MLKVDLEGYEVPVLKGALTTLKSGQIRRSIIEVTPGQDAEVIEQLLNDCRADIRIWKENRWSPGRISEIAHRTDILAKFS
jgi:hypothetical protein